MNTKIWKRNLRTLLLTPGYYYIQLPKKNHFDVVEVKENGIVTTLDGNVVNTENLPCIIKYADLMEYLHEANHQMESSERKLAGVRKSRKSLINLLNESYGLLDELTDPEIKESEDCQKECKCKCQSKENKNDKKCSFKTENNTKDESDLNGSEIKFKCDPNTTVKMSYGSKTKMTCKKVAEIAIKLALSHLIQLNYGKIKNGDLRYMIIDFIEDNFHIQSPKCKINVEFLENNIVLVEFFNPTSKTDRFKSDVEFSFN